MTPKTPLGENISPHDLGVNNSSSWQADTQFRPWMQMFLVSSVLTLVLSGIVWCFALQYWITQAFIVLFIGLGWMSPVGRWGSILGSTSSAVLLLCLALQPEYGVAGQVTYGVGFFLFSTVIILLAAGARSLLRRRYITDDELQCDG